MKRALAAIMRSLLACAFALACFGVPCIAESAEPLEVDFSISPAEMVAPGDVTMTFIMRNRSEYDLENIYITSADGLISEPVGQLGSGETQTLVRPHSVTQDELDDGAVRYIVSHDAPVPGGEKVSRMLSAYIVQGSARPDVDFTRQLSTRYVVPGSQLTITYKLTNNGNVPAEDVEVRDALGDFTGRLERLDIGATRTFISRVTISAEAESAASLSYSVPGGERIERDLDPVSVQLSSSVLEPAFYIGVSAFDPGRAEATLILNNTGTDDFTDITVIDDVYGGVITDAVALPAGSSREISYTYPVRGDGEYRWRVTGESQAGEVLDYATETLTLSDADKPASIDVELAAKARATKINRAGYVSFDIELRNTGTVMAKDLSLYEVNLGEIRKLAVLPTGEPMRLSVRYEVREDRQFVFCVGYEDAGGHARTVTAPAIDVAITPAGVPPEDSGGETDEAPKGPSVKMGTTSTFTILLAVASAALVSMFTILLVTSLRARRDRRRRIAAQRQRRRNVTGRGPQTSRRAPGRAKNTRKKAGSDTGRVSPSEKIPK